MMTPNGRMSRHGNHLGSPARPYTTTDASKQATAAAAMMSEWWAAFTGCPHCNVVQDSVIPCALHEAALIYP